MLIPLKQWFCDNCGEVINSHNEGWVEWLYPDTKKYGFKIVHHAEFSPNKPEGNCYFYNDSIGRQDIYLSDFVGTYQAARILFFLYPGVYHIPEYKGHYIKDIREFAEFVRRLTIPHYEEARLYWSQSIADGLISDQNEVSIFDPNLLKKIVEKYSEVSD